MTVSAQKVQWQITSWKWALSGFDLLCVQEATGNVQFPLGPFSLKEVELASSPVAPSRNNA